MPPPQLLATEAVAVDDRGPPKSIDSFACLDDDDVYKVYVTLEGDLFGITEADVTATFKEVPVSDGKASMTVVVRGAKHNHRLAADQLFGPVDVSQCKVKLSKKKDKLIVSLRKAVQMPWDDVRAKVALPFRRGGGGAPR